MQTERPYVLTIAGFDPCSGAGLTADIKTFEQLKVYGLAVCTGYTVQTEDQFISVEWRKMEDIKNEIEVLLQKYPVKAVKFGIIPSFDFLKQMIVVLKKYNSEMKIVVDPVWRSSSGFLLNESEWIMDKPLLENITLLTPNVPELEFIRNGKSQEQFIKDFTANSNLLLKGGHSEEKPGTDILFRKNGQTEIKGSEKKLPPKHGSGCVLSAAITAHLAVGKPLEDACKSGKQYVEKFLESNTSLLGFHA